MAIIRAGARISGKQAESLTYGVMTKTINNESGQIDFYGRQYMSDTFRDLKDDLFEGDYYGHDSRSSHLIRIGDQIGVHTKQGANWEKEVVNPNVDKLSVNTEHRGKDLYVKGAGYIGKTKGGELIVKMNFFTKDGDNLAISYTDTYDNINKYLESIGKTLKVTTDIQSWHTHQERIIYYSIEDIKKDDDQQTQ